MSFKVLSFFINEVELGAQSPGVSGSDTMSSLLVPNQSLKIDEVLL